MEKYHFARNINNTGMTGIVDVFSSELIIYCTEAESKVVLEALKICSNRMLSDSLATCQRCHKPKPSDKYLMCPTCYGDFY